MVCVGGVVLWWGTGGLKEEHGARETFWRDSGEQKEEVFSKRRSHGRRSLVGCAAMRKKGRRGPR